MYLIMVNKKYLADKNYQFFMFHSMDGAQEFINRNKIKNAKIVKAPE